MGGRAEAAARTDHSQVSGQSNKDPGSGWRFPIGGKMVAESDRNHAQDLDC